jgi:hypothetical protein
MKYISDILKQFTKQQRLLVIIIILVFSSVTFLLSIYLKSSNSDCQGVVELNKKYLNDFIVISNMIREERLNRIKQDSIAVSLVNEMVMDSSNTLKSNDIVDLPIVFEDRSDLIFDSILSVTESNFKK